jgi:prephenate dehydratase
MRIAYLGPLGTFGHEAAKLRWPNVELAPYPSHIHVLEAVKCGEVKFGIVATENSIDGPVTDVLDWFTLQENNGQVQIGGEIFLPINMCVLAKPGTRPEDIEMVISHTKGLGQCAQHIRKEFPTAALLEVGSTAAAVQKMLAMDAPAVALAGRAAAQDGVTILRENFQDMPENTTRFWVAGKERMPPTGCDKTSIVFQTLHRPGELYASLGILARWKINLTRIESRPSKRKMGEYVFLMDVDGHQEDEPLTCALSELRSSIPWVRVLGSYPQWAV